MKLFLDKNDKPDLRFTHDKEIINGIKDKPDNAVIYYIGNYPTEEIVEKVDCYAKQLKPPNEMWDAVLNTGNSREQGSGWNSTGFRTKYMEYIMDDEGAFLEAKHVKARGKVRPIYIGHHPEKQMYSPANVCINMIENAIQLPIERENNRFESMFGGRGG